MRKVKIFGAGSVGNHLANACRSLDWEVLICDLDEDALLRTKNEIYPSRYGEWDEKIKLAPVSDAPREGFDLVIIGTPPDTHMKIAIQTIEETRPKVILIEKPMATLSLAGCQELYDLAKETDTIVCVGYNHTLGRNTLEAEKLLNAGTIGKALTMESGFREYWGGIFLAHPWLSGPQDSYLGFSEKGGGASGEHSHAANLWQHFSHVLNKGRITEVTAVLDFVENQAVLYDRVCTMTVKTEKGFIGSIVQDVVTEPTSKKLRLQGDKGFIEWYAGFDEGHHAVIFSESGKNISKLLLPTSRPEDFILEVKHLKALLDGEIHRKDSPVSIERGLDTMLVVAAAHLSNRKKCTAHIDYSKGYSLEALSW